MNWMTLFAVLFFLLSMSATQLAGNYDKHELDYVVCRPLLFAVNKCHSVSWELCTGQEIKPHPMAFCLERL